MLLISDANILIDLEEGGVLEALFRLPQRIGVPDILFEDELRAQHEHLLRLGLVLIEPGRAALTRLIALTQKHPRPSRMDLAALVTAEQEGCPLLTGDRHLRIAAEAEGLPVFGTLWVAEQFVTTGLLTVDELEAAYNRMRARGRRLPWVEVERQVSRLKGVG